MVAVVTSKENFELVQEVNRLFRFDLKYITESNPKKLLNLLTKGEAYRQYIIDFDFLTGNVDENFQCINQLYEAQGLPIVVLVQGEPAFCELVQEEIGKSTRGVITEDYAAGIRKELMDFFQSFDVPEPESSAEPQGLTSDPVEQKSEAGQKEKLLFRPDFHKTTTIAIAGVVPRIGTTTQAMQIVKYLEMQNKTACYVDLTGRNDLELYPQVYEGIEADTEQGRIFYEGLQLYYKPERIAGILNQEYDFVVYDFGVYPSLSKELKVSYLEKDVHLLVCGAKPGEIAPLLKSVFPDLSGENVKYIFSFIHSADMFEVKASMGEKGEDTFFAAYTPSPGKYNSENEAVHRKILQSYMTLNPRKKAEPKKKKLFFFGGNK